MQTAMTNDKDRTLASPMKYTSYLPPELVDQIYDEAKYDRGTLMRCLQVCHAWRSVAYPRVFSRVRIPEQSAPSATSCTRDDGASQAATGYTQGDFAHRLMTAPHFAAAIRDLRVPKSAALRPGFLKQIVHRLPNLVSLDLDVDELVAQQTAKNDSDAGAPLHSDSSAAPAPIPSLRQLILTTKSYNVLDAVLSEVFETFTGVDELVIKCPGWYESTAPFPAVPRFRDARVRRLVFSNLPSDAERRILSMFAFAFDPTCLKSLVIAGDDHPQWSSLLGAVGEHLTELEIREAVGHVLASAVPEACPALCSISMCIVIPRPMDLYAMDDFGAALYLSTTGSHESGSWGNAMDVLQEAPLTLESVSFTLRPVDTYARINYSSLPRGFDVLPMDALEEAIESHPAFKTLNMSIIGRYYGPREYSVTTSQATFVKYLPPSAQKIIRFGDQTLAAQ